MPDRDRRRPFYLRWPMFAGAAAAVLGGLGELYSAFYFLSIRGDSDISHGVFLLLSPLLLAMWLLEGMCIIFIVTVFTCLCFLIDWAVRKLWERHWGWQSDDV